MADISDGFILEWDIIKADRYFWIWQMISNRCKTLRQFNRWLETVIAQSKYSVAEHYQPVIVEVRF
jgi:hypothetical protein